MSSSSINNILEEIDKLSEDDKEYLRELIYKQLIETKRESILHRAKEAEVNYNTDNVKKGSADNLIYEFGD